MKVIIRMDIKRALKDPTFWVKFPEYRSIKEDIDSGRLKVGCCNLSSSLYKNMIELITKSPQKWKEYLKQDKIKVYTEKGVIVY